MRAFRVALGASQVGACGFANSGMSPPDDPIHYPLKYGKGVDLGEADPGYTPDRISFANNAFPSNSLLRPPFVTGSDKSLADELLDFAATQSEEMCYWSFQPLGPPVGPGPNHWDFSNGQWDDDIQFESMLSSVANARLQRLHEPDGPLVSNICAVGSAKAQRRCENGQVQAETWRDGCDPVVLNQELRWGMAIAILKIDPRLKDWVRYWRSNATFGHTPQIQWTYRGGQEPFGKMKGPVPPPTEVSPAEVPTGPEVWPASSGASFGAGPGAGMLAKVVPCSQVPRKFYYSEEHFFCDHVSAGANRTSADENYAAWKDATSVWPPTKECTDDVDTLNYVMQMYTNGTAPLFKDCADAYAQLEVAIPNFDGCNAVWPVPGAQSQFRDACCSQCGHSPIPDFPVPPAPAPPTGYICTICGHVFDASEDGAGVSFDDLPDAWTCPICGMPKSAYTKLPSEAVDAIV